MQNEGRTEGRRDEEEGESKEEGERKVTKEEHDSSHHIEGWFSKSSLLNNGCEHLEKSPLELYPFSTYSYFHL